jgi:hypothetical protein
MPRGENLKAIPPEERARRLGVAPLLPGEAGRGVYVRAPKEVLDAFLALTARERGKVVKAGLEALGYLRGEERREP